MGRNEQRMEMIKKIYTNSTFGKNFITSKRKQKIIKIYNKKYLDEIFR